MSKMHLTNFQKSPSVGDSTTPAPH